MKTNTLSLMVPLLVALLSACAPVEDDPVSTSQAMLPDFRNPPSVLLPGNNLNTPPTCTQALWNAGGCHLVVVTPYATPHEQEFWQKIPGPGRSTLPTGPATRFTQVGHINARTSSVRLNMAVMRDAWIDACYYQPGRLFPTCYVAFNYADAASSDELMQIFITGEPDSGVFPNIQVYFVSTARRSFRQAETYAVPASQPTTGARAMNLMVIDSWGNQAHVPNPLGATLIGRYPAWRAD